MKSIFSLELYETKYAPLINVGCLISSRNTWFRSKKSTKTRRRRGSYYLMLISIYLFSLRVNLECEHLIGYKIVHNFFPFLHKLHSVLVGIRDDILFKLSNEVFFSFDSILFVPSPSFWGLLIVFKWPVFWSFFISTRRRFLFCRSFWGWILGFWVFRENHWLRDFCFDIACFHFLNGFFNRDTYKNEQIESRSRVVQRDCR